MPPALRAAQVFRVWFFIMPSYLGKEQPSEKTKVGEPYERFQWIGNHCQHMQTQTGAFRQNTGISPTILTIKFSETRLDLRILLILWPRRGHKINKFTQDYASFA
ncbi:hypothetical protein IQ267_12085 [filamentous cyanobacterium LEGE 07170]|nr:hypothetical protein [filamentous cyanobacterium LEGE 07170]